MNWGVAPEAVLLPFNDIPYATIEKFFGKTIVFSIGQSSFVRLYLGNNSIIKSLFKSNGRHVFEMHYFSRNILYLLTKAAPYYYRLLEVGHRTEPFLILWPYEKAPLSF